MEHVNTHKYTHIGIYMQYTERERNHSLFLSQNYAWIPILIFQWSPPRKKEAMAYLTNV